MRPSLVLSPAFAIVAVVAVVGGCDALTIAPTNPFDPEAPPELQARGAVHGTLLLRDVIVDGERVGERESIANVTVSLRDAAGSLLREDGQLLARALFEIEPEHDDESALGRFFIDDLVPGFYAVVFNDVPAAYGVTGDINVVVSPGGDADMGTLELAYAFAADGRGPYGIDGAVTVVGSTSPPPQRVTLYRRRDTTTTFVAQQSGLGAFAFTGLSSGTYAVVVEADGSMPTYALDIPVNSTQPQTSYTNDAALPLLPVSAALLPLQTGAGAVTIVDGRAWVRDEPVPLGVLSVDGFGNDDEQGDGGRIGVQKMRLATNPDFKDDVGGDRDR